MNSVTDNVLSGVERLTGYLGPLTALFDHVVERIAPKTTAQASCAGSVCWTACSIECCAFCFFGLDWHVKTLYYSTHDCSDTNVWYCPVNLSCGSC